MKSEEFEIFSSSSEVMIDSRAISWRDSNYPNFTVMSGALLSALSGHL